MFSPEFPRWLVILCNWGFGSLVLLTVFQLGLDMIHLVSRVMPVGGFSSNGTWRYGISIAAMLLVAVGGHQAIRVPPLKDVEIQVPGLPEAFDGYRTLQVTDMHISRLFPASWTQEVVKRSNALGVDLIVVTGDLIDGYVSARREDVEPLRRLKAQDGVWVIPGNHEYYFNGER